jgi:uncharacterized protein YdhG (YjbR/CyaY superfamily)
MTVDGYISRFQPKVQRILRKIRTTVRSAAPKAEEVISYRMPALRQNGILIWYAAFTNHIGLYPPIRGDAKLVGQAARYAGEKGNLRFPLDEAIPYRLIAGLTKLRARQAEVSPLLRKRRRNPMPSTVRKALRSRGPSCPRRGRNGSRRCSTSSLAARAT